MAPQRACLISHATHPLWPPVLPPRPCLGLLDQILSNFGLILVSAFASMSKPPVIDDVHDDGL